MDPNDPHYILGVSPGASRAELKARYIKLVQMNHPDKVASLDPYLQQVATERTKRIIDAYNSLVAH
jgi:preprotein translocase subunit Sec63